MAAIDLKNVAVRFKTYHGYSSGLKELAMRVLSPPSWSKKRPPQKTTFWGLKNIELSLKEGDRLGVIGRNGAGKSTLLKVISRIYRPTLGTVNVQGRLAPLIEIGAGFNPELSGKENVYLNGAILGLPRKALSQRMEAILDFSGLKDFSDMPVKYYSTGMHLRLAFSIATEVSPDILILDELFTGGDANFLEKANARLKLFIEKSKILILVTHSLHYVKQHCNTAILLDHGEVVTRGQPSEVIQEYEKLSRDQKP